MSRRSNEHRERITPFRPGYEQMRGPRLHDIKAALDDGKPDSAPRRGIPLGMDTPVRKQWRQ
jgi:hypothetical protein